MEGKKRLRDICKNHFCGRDNELRGLRDVLESVREKKENRDLTSEEEVEEAKKISKIIIPWEMDRMERRYSFSSHDDFMVEDLSSGSFVRERDSQDEEAESFRKFVFISGLPGSGKTTLVQNAFQNAQCLFCRGKFEQDGRSSPFAALMACFNELSSTMTVIQTLPESEGSYASLIQAELEVEEIAILARMIPNISKLLGSSFIPSEDAPQLSAQSKEDLERLRFILRNFLATVATKRRPVVMFLDDMQWIDDPSLQLLKTVVNNSQLHHFLFVGTFRSDEVKRNHSLSSWIKELKSPFRIRLNNLNLNYLWEMLKVALEIKDYDEERLVSLRDLAALLHSRTGGNVFHFLELLDFLQAEKLLTCDRISLKWNWDIEEIRNHTNLSENVLKVVVSRIRRLPEKVCDLLQLCALFGYRMDQKLVVAVRRTASNCDEQEVLQSLELLTKEGLLEYAHGRLKFVHDKVYQAASEMQEQAKENHLTIGRELRKLIDLEKPDLLDSVSNTLFTCADQLNVAHDLITEQDEVVDFAKLNLAAARKAAGRGGFIPAARFAEFGLAKLDHETSWIHHYQLTLELASLMAEMYSIVGETEKLNRISEAVLTHAVDVKDKIRIYTALVQVPMAEQCPERSYAESVKFLSQLGAILPDKPDKDYALQEYEKLRERLESLSDQEIMSLPSMTDPVSLGAMQILASQLTTVSIRTDLASVDVITCLMINISLDKGLSPNVAPGFMFFANQVIIRGNLKLARRCAKLSLALLDVSGGGNYERARVLIGSCFVLHWSEPLSRLTDKALSAYTYGMKYGDTVTGFFAVLVYVALYFYSGLPLKPLVEDCDSMASVLSEYGHQSMLLGLLPFEQCAKNLLGHSEDILDLNQGSLKEVRTHLGWKPGGSGTSTEDVLCMQIAFYCEEYELAFRIMKHVQDNTPEMLLNSWQGQQRVFFFCLMNLRALKEPWASSPTTRFRREAEKHYEQMRRWVSENGSINSAHKLLILQAEMKFLDRGTTPTELKAAYDKGIAAATRAGFLQDGALAAHLASRAFPEEESAYWELAVTLYKRWGAVGVVRYIAKRRQDSSSLEAVQRSLREPSFSGFRAMRRFDSAPDFT